ncbi:MAG: hypothetical protein A2157_17805 [Deltaproteobacteria bacterium RBG_16_47_11]|nr:MAG: hypothetical protein A2157_17805 [Deltaproteobacteria bacterium RBG_16_47_11]
MKRQSMYAIAAAAGIALCASFLLAQQPSGLRVGVHQSIWVPTNMLTNLQPSKDSGKVLLLLKIGLENTGSSPIDLSSETDFALSEPQAQKAKTMPVPLKGIFIDQAFTWVGVPEGVDLRTESGWSTSVSLNPKRDYIGTHWYFPVGKYKLTLNPGAKMTLPILFELEKDKQQFDLYLKGGKILRLPLIDSQSK